MSYCLDVLRGMIMSIFETIYVHGRGAGRSSERSDGDGILQKICRLQLLFIAMGAVLAVWPSLTPLMAFLFRHPSHIRDRTTAHSSRHCFLATHALVAS